MPAVFQNFDVYPLYMERIHARARPGDYRSIWDELVADRFVALHMLEPLLNGTGGQFAIGGDPVSQRAWAKAHGIREDGSLDSILLAQIEDSGAEVFYNMGPLTFGSDFVRKLPGNIRTAIAWRAAPSPGADFSAYDKVVCNFESILQSYRDRGWNAAWFYPAFDPVMAEYRQANRATDIVFIGTYSRHHGRRAEVVEAIAKLGGRHEVRIHLQQSRMTRLAGTPLGLIPPLRRHRLPDAIASVARPPVFGRDLYCAFGEAKIVINGAIDMSGSDRGNMRCWESLGCGALMLSDAGVYPPGMEDGVTIGTYRDVADMVVQIERLLDDEGRRRTIADAGSAMIAERYSKAQQWKDFVSLL
jgi:hypothetical protein